MTPRPDFTFSRFVPIASSTRARRASKAIALDRPNAPTVLVLHGPAGTGKTHLLHAIAHVARSHPPVSRLQLVSAADLRARVVEAVRRDRLQEMERELEHVEILLVDDLQALSGIPETQSVVARLLGAAARCGVRVVMASGAAPADLRSLLDGLRLMTRTRTVALSAPSPDDMHRLLATFLGAETSLVRRRVLSSLIDRSQGDIRRLQGASSVCALASI